MNRINFSRRSVSTSSGFFALVLLCTSPCLAGKVTDLVIDNAPQTIPEGGITAILHGVSVVTTSPMFLQSASAGVAIPTDVVVAAIKTTPELRKALKLPDNLNGVNFSDILYAARTVRPNDVSTYRSSVEGIKGVYCGIPKQKDKDDHTVSWDKLKCDRTATYSPEAIGKLLVFNGFDTSNTIVHKVGDSDVSFVAMRPSYANTLIMGNVAAGQLKSSMSASATDNIAAFDRFYSIVNGTHGESIDKVAFLNNNTVTFGVPYVETSKELGLKIPKYISDRFDVYLLHLAMTWRELPRYQIDELDYSVIMPRDEIALELIPMRYGIKISEQTKNQISPSVEADGVKVELGELYGRDISFTYLKPTIQAYGLQESRFSWSMRDQAVQPGAEEFLCAVGVPKHARQLDLTMSASARWSGSFVAAGGVETTDQVVQSIPLW